MIPAPRPRPHPALLYGGLLVQTLLAAGTYLFAKRSLQELPWLQLGLVRFSGASVLLALLLRREPRGERLPPRDTWPRLLGLSLVAVPINQGFFLGGLQLTTAAHSALLYTLTPLFVLLLARVLLGEPLGGRAALGTALALAGALFVLLSRGLLEATPGARPLLGDALVFVAVVAWAIYITEGRPLVARFGPLRVIAWTLIGGTLLYLPLGLGSLLSGALRAQLVSASAAAWWGVAYLAVATSVVSYLLNFWALGHLPAARVAVFANLQPLETALFAWLFLGERITGSFLGGAALVIGGVILAQSARPVVVTEP